MKIRRFLRDRSGLASIEFAVMAPLVFTAMFGVIGVGWVYFERDNVTEAMRLGVRDIIVNRHDSAATIEAAFASRLAQHGWDETGLVVSVSDVAGVPTAQVTYTWNLDLSVPFVDRQVLSGVERVDIPI